MIIKKVRSFYLFFVLFYIVWTLRATLFYSAVDTSIANETTRLIFANVVKIVLWVIPAVAFILWIDKENPLEVMRISSEIDRYGVRLGLVISLLYFLGVFVFEYFVNGRTLLPLLRSTPPSIFTSFLVVLVSPFAEELLFRGFVLSKLQESQNFWAANLWQSGLFAAMHVPLWIWLNGLNPNLLITFISIFILGLLLGWITFRTNTIWMAIVIHILNNFLVSFLS
jgi:membrane protease YdiL (CAAX protease family)